MAKDSKRPATKEMLRRYDFIINTEHLSIDDAVNAVVGILGHVRKT